LFPFNNCQYIDFKNAIIFYMSDLDLRLGGLNGKIVQLYKNNNSSIFTGVYSRL